MSGQESAEKKHNNTELALLHNLIDRMGKQEGVSEQQGESIKTLGTTIKDGFKETQDAIGDIHSRISRETSARQMSPSTVWAAVAGVIGILGVVWVIHNTSLKHLTATDDALAREAIRNEESSKERHARQADLIKNFSDTQKEISIILQSATTGQSVANERVSGLKEKMIELDIVLQREMRLLDNETDARIDATDQRLESTNSIIEKQLLENRDAIAELRERVKGNEVLLDVTTKDLDLVESEQRRRSTAIRWDQ